MSGRRKPASPAVDILVQSPLWQAAPDAEPALRRAIAEAASMVSTSDGELAIVLTDDSAIRALNRQWRGKDAATNVLSFPARKNLPPSPLAGEGRGGGKPNTSNGRTPPPVALRAAADASHRRSWRQGPRPKAAYASPAGGGGRKEDGSAPVLLGDIMIAYETAAREAAAENKLFMHHLAHLAVHGFLHLLGYGHEAEKEADSMERLEIAILARLGVPDPYLLTEAKT